MSVPRIFDSATALNDGTVLIAGGIDRQGKVLDSAEIYDPVADNFTLVGNMTTPRDVQGAAKLSDGTVLIAGGFDGHSPVSSAEIYDPISKTFHATSHRMNFARENPSATTVTGGLALVAGGFDMDNVWSNGEVYDLASGEFFVTGPMSSPRLLNFAAALPSGEVLVGGGATFAPGQGNTLTSTVDIFDPGTFKFRPTGAPLHIARDNFSSGLEAAVLPDGKVLVVSGVDNQGTLSGFALPEAEIYDPVLDNFTVTGGMNAVRAGHTSTLLVNGTILITGGGNGANLPQASAEIFDPATTLLRPTTGPMNIPRAGHAAVLLKNGQVLIVGGGSTTTAEIYDPASDTFRLTSGVLDTAPVAETATLLPNGTVLVAGGLNNDGDSVSSAVIYNPKTDQFTGTAGAMQAARAIHVAVLLKNGTVLLAGGGTDSVLKHAIASAEIYDPKTGKFSSTGSMASPRVAAAAVAGPGGGAVVMGGVDTSQTILSSAEVFDPKAGKFSGTETPMLASRAFQTATILKDGRVLVAGGRSVVSRAIQTTASTEFYNFQMRSFTAGPNMTTPRDTHAATLMKGGGVFISGGGSNGDILPTAEVFTQ